MLVTAAVLFTLIQATSQGQYYTPVEDGTRLFRAYVGTVVGAKHQFNFVLVYLRRYCTFSSSQYLVLRI
jgi:hypothetical protein